MRKQVFVIFGNCSGLEEYLVASTRRQLVVDEIEIHLGYVGH